MMKVPQVSGHPRVKSNQTPEVYKPSGVSAQTKLTGLSSLRANTQKNILIFTEKNLSVTIVEK
jgi:hypothetical protein